MAHSVIHIKKYEDALEGMKCGVLSQDAVYNLYAEQRALHFKMMRLALDYLEF